MFFAGRRGHRFVDRGDPASVDFAVGDLTADGDYHDLDLSSIIPKNAKLVLLRLVINNAFELQTTRFRKNGNSNAIADFYYMLLTPNSDMGISAVLPCDENGVIEYNIGNVAWASYDVTVAGWFI